MNTSERFFTLKYEKCRVEINVTRVGKLSRYKRARLLLTLITRKKIKGTTLSRFSFKIDLFPLYIDVNYRTIRETSIEWNWVGINLNRCRVR